MKKLFTLLIFALLAITSAWAETLTYTYALDDPDAYPTGFPTKDGTIASAEEFIISGHPLIINAPNYYIINSTSTNGSRGLIFGKSTTTLETAYLQFPAVAGYALTKVEVTTTSNQATSTKCNIYSTSWSAMSTAVTLGKSTTSTFELTNPQANTAYRFATSNSSKNIQLTGITLTYESTSTSGKTATTLSFGSDWDGKEITKYIGEAVFTCPIATLTPTVEGATITYSSSDENVAAIVDGTIMLGDAGTTTISASYAGNDNYEASSASFTINLQKLPDPTFSVKDGSYVVAGTEVTITAPENCTISYIINDGEVQYSATNTEKITINEGTTILACSRYQGAKNIVESEGAEATYNIKTLESIAISGTPNKTAYAPGEAFNTTGLTVTPKYSDGSTSPAISGATLTFAPETFSMGDNTVTVTATYGELTDTKTFDVTVQGFESGTYTLVTSADALVDGAEYVLLTTDGNLAASTYGSNKITTVAAGDNTFSLVGNVVTTYSTSVNVLTIAASDTKWTITDQDGVKFASSGSNTNITNGSGTFTISFDEDGNVSIVGVSGRLWLSNGTVIGNYSSSNANASDYSKLKLYKSGGVALPAKPTFDPEDGTTFTESLKVTITPDDGCKVKYQLGEAEAVTAADTNPVELTLTESTTITAWSVDASDETRVSPSATAKYTKIDPTKTYSLVTSDDQLESGAEYVLVNKTGDKIASKFSIDKITTVGSTDNYDLDTNNNIVTVLSDDVNVFTFTGDASNGWTITDKNDIVYTSNNENELSSGTATVHTISISDDGTVKISAKTYPSRQWKFNSSLIRNYQSGTGSAPYLYKSNAPVVEKPDAPTFNPADGTTFTTPTATVTITAAEGCTLKYTLGDGEEQTAGNSTEVAVTPTAYTIKAKSVNAEGVESKEATATYTFVKPAVPTFNPADGTTFTTESATVTITAAEGCTLKYTVGDGEEETAGNSAEVTVTPTAYTIKAKSVNAEGLESEEAIATYTFNVTVHVKNIAEFMVLPENTTAIFDNPVVVLYDYSQPSTKKDDTTGEYSNPEYIWVKDETGHTNIYFEVAIDPTNHQAKYENGDVIPAGFVAVKSYYTVGKYTQAKVETENNETFEKALLKRLADPVTITFDEFNALQVGSDADIAKWNNTYVMIPKVTMAADETDSRGKTYNVSQNGVAATNNVFYNKYSDLRDGEYALTKQGEDARVTMPTSSTTEYNVYGILQRYDQFWEIMPIRFVEYSEATVTLKELVEAGNAGTTTEGTVYTILNDLRGVVALTDNVILAKDENGNAVGKVEPAGHSFMINAKSKFDDDASEESVNTKAQEDYDQSNWVEIVLPTGVSASSYVDKIITGLSVKGLYTNTLNPRLEVTEAPTQGGETGAYTRNAMCPANFMGTSQACNSEEKHGDYFFMTPKPNECVQVVWAVYNSTAGAFYIPAAEGSINTHAFKGAFGIDWTYNAGGEIKNLVEGTVYQFKAVVKKQAPAAQSGKRKVAYDNSQPLSTDYLVYPLNLDANCVTGITDATGSKAVKSVRYFNIMGVELAEPAAGVNIVLTTYTDGTTRSQKILK